MAEIDKIAEAYNKGFRARGEHSHPSPETKQFMIKVEDTFNEIKSRINDLPTKECMALENAKLLDNMMTKVEERFAPKWVEKVMVWGMGTVGTAILLSVIGLVLLV